MYVWLWRRFPGGWLGKLGCSLVLVAAAVALLFFVVFPWVEPRLPFSDVTVNNPGGAAPSSPGPVSTAPAVPAPRATG